MKCPFCGEEIQDDSNYCGECGKRITPDKPKRKKHKGRRWIIVIISLLVIFAGADFAVQKHMPKRSPYQYNIVRSTINSVIAQITGNKNKIVVPDKKKHMKALAESMVEDLFTQLKMGKQMEMLEDMCEIAEKYSAVRSREFVQIDCYENMRESFLTGMSEGLEKEGLQLEDLADEEDMYMEMSREILLTTLGGVSGTTSLSVGSGFYMLMEKNGDYRTDDSVWILKYTDQLYVGLIFAKNNKGMDIAAYPLYVEDIQQFHDRLELFYEDHETFY